MSDETLKHGRYATEDDIAMISHCLVVLRRRPLIGKNSNRSSKTFLNLRANRIQIPSHPNSRFKGTPPGQNRSGLIGYAS